MNEPLMTFSPSHSVDVDLKYYILPYRYPVSAEDYFSWRPFWKMAKGRGVEVGVLEGQNSESALKYCPIEKLYLVDPFKSYHDHVGNLSNINQNLFDIIYKRVCERFETDDRVDIIRKPSVEASRDFEDNSLDFVYLDGNHAEKAVREDLRAWMPKLKPRGLMGGHDVIEGSVMGALAGYFDEESPGYFETKINSWWFYKDME